MVLKAFTTRAAGLASAISSAADIPGLVSSESNVEKSTGLQGSTTVIPDSAAPWSRAMRRPSGYGSASTTRSAPAIASATSATVTSRCLPPTSGPLRADRLAASPSALPGASSVSRSLCPPARIRTAIPSASRPAPAIVTIIFSLPQ